MVHRFHCRLWIIIVAFLPLTVIAVPLGCNPQTVPASGTVTLDGLPLDGALLAFVPTDETGRIDAATLSASGVTGPAGTFTLRTSTRGGKSIPGAITGHYKVTVAKIEAILPLRDLSGNLLDPNQNYNIAVQGRLATPERYADAQKSRLTADVTEEGPNVFAFNLTTSQEPSPKNEERLSAWNLIVLLLAQEAIQASSTLETRWPAQ